MSPGCGVNYVFPQGQYVSTGFRASFTCCPHTGHEPLHNTCKEPLLTEPDPVLGSAGSLSVHDHSDQQLSPLSPLLPDDCADKRQV